VIHLDQSVSCSVRRPARLRYLPTPTAMPRRRLPQPPAASGAGVRAHAVLPFGAVKANSDVGVIDTGCDPLLGWSFDTGTDHSLADFSVDTFKLVDDQELLDSGIGSQWGHGYQPTLPASSWADFAPGLPPVYKRLSPSAHSSVSSTTSVSNGTTLSPVNTDFQSVADGNSAASTWSRGPSPLHQLAGRDDHDVVDLCDATAAPHADVHPSLVPEAGSTTTGDSLAGLQTGFSHVCSWAGCRTAGFRSRDGLNWHVKADHLLICPVPGCSQANFQSKKMLDSHLRVVHANVDEKTLAARGDKEMGAGQTVQPVLPAPSASQADEGTTPKQNPSWDAVNDPAMKMTLSIATSKRKCREQLKAVLEKRLRRSAAGGMRTTETPVDSADLNAGTPRSVGTPRSMNSPQDIIRSRTPRLLESASFPLVWEHGVLPFLAEFVPKWCGPGHVISVTRGRETNGRRICILTRTKVSRARRLFIAFHVRDLLPMTYRQGATFWFSTGEVERLGWARGLSQDMPDEICNPRNPFCYSSPCMGDSIGTTVDDPKGESTATLGPCLLINGGGYWLANFHPFLEPFRTREDILVEHPSPRDRGRCIEEGHDALTTEVRSFALGDLLATSGIDLKTTRISHDQYWEDNDKENPLVCTDWTLISSQTKQANMLRKFPTTTPRLAKEAPVTLTSPIVPGASVISTGRSSGYQRGQVCEIPAYVSGDFAGNGTGRATREWFVEESYRYDHEDDSEWVRGGIGVEGDSGAAIVDADTVWPLLFPSPVWPFLDGSRIRHVSPSRLVSSAQLPSSTERTDADVHRTRSSGSCGAATSISGQGLATPSSRPSTTSSTTSRRSAASRRGRSCRSTATRASAGSCTRRAAPASSCPRTSTAAAARASHCGPCSGRAARACRPPASSATTPT